MIIGSAGMTLDGASKHSASELECQRSEGMGSATLITNLNDFGKLELLEPNLESARRGL